MLKVTTVSGTLRPWRGQGVSVEPGRIVWVEVGEGAGPVGASDVLDDVSDEDGTGPGVAPSSPVGHRHHTARATSAATATRATSPWVRRLICPLVRGRPLCRHC